MIPGILAAVAVLVLGVAATSPTDAARWSRRRHRAPTRRPDPVDHATHFTPGGRRSIPPTSPSGATRIARALRGGATLNHALRSVAPPPTVDDQLAPAMLALERGASVAGAFADLQTRSPASRSRRRRVAGLRRARRRRGRADRPGRERPSPAGGLGRGAPHPERSGADVGDRDDAAPRRHARHAADHLRGRSPHGSLTGRARGDRAAERCSTLPDGRG